METESESLWLVCVHKTKRHMLRFAAATNGKGGEGGVGQNTDKAK